MSSSTDQPVATLGDVRVAGQGRPVTGAQLCYAVTVRRPDPVSGSLDQITVASGMGLRAGDVLTSRAYVSGLDIVFGERIEELVGRGLIAHEVTHVIQQGRNSASPMNNGALESEGGEDESSDPPGSIGPAPFDSESVETESTE